MLKFLAGVALGAVVATVVAHGISEREKRQLVADITRLYEDEWRQPAEPF